MLNTSGKKHFFLSNVKKNTLNYYKFKLHVIKLNLLKIIEGDKNLLQKKKQQLFLKIFCLFK